MAERQAIVQFDQDPLLFLDRTFPAAGDAFWLPERRQLCVAEPMIARSILANEEGLYEEHSDFFHTRKGVFGPRSAQVQIGRSARTLLRAHLTAQAGKLTESVHSLAPVSHWPDIGNWLVYRHLVDALVAPGSPARLRRLLDAIVERAVLAGARERHSRLSRALFRLRVSRELARTIEHRRLRGAKEPADVLDVMVGATGPGVPASEIGEVFLSFLFAVAGSVGFVLGWSLYLLGTNPRTDAPPAWIVKEALRLWPVAWMLGRRPTRPHEVAGLAVTPRDLVFACPYLVHRHPRYWDDPSGFHPERWATDPDRQAFIPFGWGPHVCVAGALSSLLVEDILRVILADFEWTVTPHDQRPCIGPALAPPRFTLGLLSHRPSIHRKGGD